MKILTKENITLVIAIIGFILSSYTWIRTVIERKRNITIQDEQASWAVRYSTKKHQYWSTALFFNNKSYLQNSIVRISMIDDKGKEYFALIPPQFVAHTFRTLIDTDTKWFERIIESAKFPITLPALGSAYEYIVFQLPVNFNCDPQIFNLYTNRGKIEIKMPNFKMPPIPQNNDATLISRDQSGVLAIN